MRTQREKAMRTIEWGPNGTVKMIDQRKLPLEFVVVEFDDYRDVAMAIREMYIRGAPAIGAAAAFGLALAARQSQARDTGWAAERGPAHRRRGRGDQQAHGGLRRCPRPGWVQDGFNILTHCNAGALATVDYGTALAVVRAAHEQGKEIHVWVDETRPRFQGARLTAWELMEAGIPMTLIADNVAGHLMRSGQVDIVWQVDIVFVGSDRTAANGDVANKIGTYKLAVLARENGIPFYAVVPTSTIDLQIAQGDDIPIEVRDEREVTHVRDCQIAPDGVRVLNVAFDVTPHRYVTGIVTENGIAYPPFPQSLRRMVEG